ncbi:MAG: ARMT1-like domain-containing protein [Candidatus Aerophobetes bacterium]|nr:ARMT1-like domain-containing protein [Candidatus Aerophobetes bacterium]
MRTYLDCIPCFFRQGLTAARLFTKDEKKQKKILEEIAKEIPSISLDSTPPQIGKKIHTIIQKATGSLDPYKKIKEKYNKIALKLYPQLKSEVEKAEDSLLTAIRVAIIGNVVDFGVPVRLNLEQEIKTILNQEFAIFDYAKFKKALRETEEILYLGDNSSEVPFDKILIEQLNKKVTYAVRRKPVVNDATLEDALFFGMDKITKVISSGSDAPGNTLSLCSKKFFALYNSSKLIISKGQGNYESLSEEKRPIFFLLKAKCSIIARDLGCRKGDIVLKSEGN